MTSWLDLKYALRLLRKSWGYSLMCASVVALSVGTAVWTYSMFYSQLLKPLGFPGSERWYSLQIAAKAGSRPEPSIDAFTYQELLKQNRSADYLGAFAETRVILSEGQESRSLRAAAISPRLFAAAQVPPLLGRVFQEADAQAGATAVAVLSFDAWQTYFAKDPAIIGKTARIDTAPVRIVGVMPRDFYEIEDFELWEPLQLPLLARPSDSTMTLTPLITLGENQSLDALLNEMKAVIDAVNHDYPDLFNSARSVALIPALRMYTHSVTPILVMLSLMSAAVLLLGGVNISMVFLARMLEHSRDLALRVALGSSRARLIRQCLLETALVVVLGLVIGYGLAAIGVRWTQVLTEFLSRIDGSGRSANMPELLPIHLLAAVIFATVLWLVSTLIPAWRIAKQDPSATLASGGKGAAIRGGNKSVSVLVGLQVVVSCLVLVICGNVLLAVRKEVSRPSGLNTAGVFVSTDPTVFDGRFSQATERVRYWDELSVAIKSKIPGAEVAFATAAPARPASIPAAIETQEGTAKQGTLTLPVSVVSEDYFNLLGVSLRSGRLFESTDDSASLEVAIVDENMASRYWPDQNVLGRRVRLSPSDDTPWLTIVGVVSEVRGAPYRPNMGVLYRPLRQALPSEYRLLVKSPNAVTDIRDDIRAAAYTVDRDLPLHNLQTLDDYVAAMNLAANTLIPVMLTVALITAMLAGSGLFGLISRSVAQRTQEVGIRRAMGATPWRATSMFARQGVLYLIVAIAGIGLGIVVMPLLSVAIHNIFDDVILATTGVVLLMVAVIASASFLPTRRALGMEPGDALRYE